MSWSRITTLKRLNLLLLLVIASSLFYGETNFTISFCDDLRHRGVGFQNNTAGTKCIESVMHHEVLQGEKTNGTVITRNKLAKKSVNKDAALVAYVQHHFKHNRGATNRYEKLPFIKKITFAKYRIVFLAGLGGVGHHLFNQVLSDRDLSNCNHTCIEVSRRDKDYLWKLNGKDVSLFTSSSQESVVSAARHIMKLFRSHQSPRESTLYLNVMGQPSGSGMMSYPNFATRQSSFEPNVHILAFLAELCDVDFRVMVLLRDPESVIKSLWRRFGDVFDRSDVTPERFAIQQGYLLRQLQGLDRHFFSCVRYENVTSDAFVADREILSTSGMYSLGEAVKKVYKRKLPSSKGNLPSLEIQPNTLAWLQKTYKDLLTLCHMI